ncbi:hypothetical protein ACIQWI_03040 [Peribacillus frigoritolerans]
MIRNQDVYIKGTLDLMEGSESQASRTAKMVRMMDDFTGRIELAHLDGYRSRF